MSLAFDVRDIKTREEAVKLWFDIVWCLLNVIQQVEEQERGITD
jgi:hypothetical protein